jgi:serine/threonine protein kinase
MNENEARSFLGPMFVQDLEKMNSSLLAFVKELAESDVKESFAGNQLRLITLDLLEEPQNERLCAEYFQSTTESLGKLLDTGADATWICRLLFIIAKPARLAECLEISTPSASSGEMFDPDAFGKASASAAEQNLPRYIKAQLEGYFGSTSQAELIAKSPEKVIVRNNSLTKGDSSSDLVANSSGSGDGAADIVNSGGVDVKPGLGLDRQDFSLKGMVSPRRSNSQGNVLDDAGVDAYDQQGAETIVDQTPQFLRGTEKITHADFSFEQLISSGNFGSVYAAKHKVTGEVVAIKTIPRNMIVHRNLIGQVMQERNIMSISASPFVVTFYCSYKTSNALFMVMEFVSGGDIATLLKNVGCVDEGAARQYTAETVLALEYIHEYGVTHRDLKPANLMITASGHIKLTDFGLSQTGLMAATMLSDQNTSAKAVWGESVRKATPGSTASSTNGGVVGVGNGGGAGGGDANSGLIILTGEEGRQETAAAVLNSIVGTPGYMAPEVILGLAASPAVDWWALGTILYEMIFGCLPFQGETAETIFENTVNAKITFPAAAEGCPVASATVQDLIRHLLMKRPFARLGSQQGALSKLTGGKAELKGAVQVKRHPFFSALALATVAGEGKGEGEGEAAVTRETDSDGAGGSGSAGNCEIKLEAIDWGKLLYQKAAFIPELSSEIDTSYFDARTDRCVLCYL